MVESKVKGASEEVIVVPQRFQEFVTLTDSRMPGEETNEAGMEAKADSVLAKKLKKVLDS